MQSIMKELYWQTRRGSIRGLAGLDRLGNPWTNPKKPVLLVGNLVIFKKTVPHTKLPHHLIHPQTIPLRNPNHTHHPSTKHLLRTLGLIAESFDWDDESVSSDDEGSTKIRAFMAIAEDEPSFRKADAQDQANGLTLP
ncbi:hypothetical protein Tco_1040110 [Tanacetum coccineum]